MNDILEDGKVIEGAMVAENGMVAMLNKSEIDQQIATAHKFPRSIKRFRDEALQMVTLSEQIAQECIYSLPRDGKTIEGPSARFAEVIVSAWGNCRAGARVVSDQGEFVTAQGGFHDLEKNVAITYEVQRRIVDRKGNRFKPDMIGVTANAACSIALRNAILKGVPKAFWSSMYQAARKTVMGDFKTLANRRQDAIAEFQRYGVLPAQICATLGVAGIEDIGLESLVTLRGLLTAIQDGDTTPEQAFAPDANKSYVQQPRAKSDPKPENGQKPTGDAQNRPESADASQGAGSLATESSAAPPPSSEHAAPPTAPEAGAVAGPNKPMIPGQIRIVRAKLTNAGLSESDLVEKFGAIESLRFEDFALIQAWLSEKVA